MAIRFFAREEFFGYLLFDRLKHKYVSPMNRTALEATRIIVGERRAPTAEELARSAGEGESASRRTLAEAEEISLRPENISIEARHPRENSISAPLNVYLDHTSFCNLTCTFCYDYVKLSGRKRPDELTHAEIVSVLDQLREMGTFRIDIAGGEPTLWKKFFLGYLDEARKRDIAVSATSNGTLIDDEFAEAIIERGLKTLTISIDGWNAETNDAVRGEGAFAKACRGVEALVRAKERMGADLPIAIKYTFAPSLAEEEARNYVRLGIRLRVDKVKFNPMRPSGRAELWNALTANPTAYYRALGNIQRAIAAHSHEIEVSGPMNPATCFGGRIPHLQKWGCIAGKELIAIDSVGNVRPCSMMTDYILGNIRQQRIRDLYENSPRNVALREARDESCTGCQAYSACGGGCRVRSMSAGNMFRKDPLCPVDAGIPVKIHPAVTPAFEYLGLPHSL